MTTPAVHFITYASHRDVRSACGLDAFGWEQPEDPEGTVGGDHEGKRVYFAAQGEETRVTCPGCRPKAEEALEGRRQYEADVAAAGGEVAYRAQLDARVAVLREEKEAKPRGGAGEPAWMPPYDPTDPYDDGK